MHGLKPEYYLLLMAGKGSIVNLTTFNQALGAELLTNGDFSAWTADDPDGWTVTGEVGADPAVSQVDPSGGAGTGAARFFSSITANAPTLSQGPLTAGLYYQGSVTVSARTAGTIRMDISNSAVFTHTSASEFQGLSRANVVTYRVRAIDSAPQDFVVDSASVRQITLNTQQTTQVSATHTFTFTLPGSPVAGQEAHLVYRIPASDPFLNGWDAYVRRNTTNTAWDFRLDSISAGVRTNRVSVTGVGTPDAIRVITNGDDHTCFTGVAGTYTARGTTITNTTHNTATGLNVIYSNAVTPVRLESAL